MADTQTSPAPTSGMPDLNSLYGGGVDPALTSGLADLERRKISADTAAESRLNKTLDEDSARMKAAFAAEGASAHDIKPWDEKAESAKHNYDPIEAFGSVGSVFAILASAFTHQPMENALNGAASAMNAIKAGKNEEYKRAYDAWKSNTELAEKRHQMMHEEYVDAGELLKTNLAAGRAKMTAAAARFGDQKTLFLLEHGMDKELIDLQNARDTSAIKMGEAKLKMQAEFAKIGLLYDMKDKDGKQMYDPQNPGSPKSQEAYQKWMHLTSPYSAHSASADQTFIQQYYTEHPDATAEQFMKAFGEFKQAQKAGGPGGTDSKTWAGQKAARLKQLNTETGPGHEEDNIRRVNHEFGEGVLTPTSSENLRSRIDLLGHSMDKLDEAVNTLHKHIGAAGAAGYATRLGERVGNILGSNATDRDNFMRTIEYLRLEAPRLLTDSHGRPMSAEAERINHIIGGLNIGDTTANTLRNLEEISTLYAEMRNQSNQRLKGTWKGPDEAPAAHKSDTDWYKSAPKVGE